MNIEPLARQFVDEYIDNYCMVNEELQTSIFRNEKELNEFYEEVSLKENKTSDEVEFIHNFENMMRDADVEGYMYP